MKTKVLCCFLFQLYIITVASQSLIDPYFRQYDSGNPGNPISPPPIYKVTRNANLINVYESWRPDFHTNSGFDGEYMISLRGDADLWNDYILLNNAVTYKMEIVSYPFCMPSCWENGGCGDYNGNPNDNISLTERNLYMPTAAYSSSTGKWSLLCNYRLDGTITQQPIWPAGGSAWSGSLPLVGVFSPTS